MLAFTGKTPCLFAGFCIFGVNPTRFLMPGLLRNLLFALLLLSVQPGWAQLPLFEDESPLNVRLEGPWSKVQADRGGNPAYHPVLMRYTDGNGVEQQFGVQVKVRGNYRRDSAICGFPPLRVKFDKDEDLPLPFSGQKKLKMITHCSSDEYILKEYYLYKVYQLLHPLSFRVRLMKVEYVDSEGVLPTEQHFAFFLEDDGDLADRLGASKVEEGASINSSTVDQDALLSVHLFNFLIANLDFDITVRQNVEVITNPDRSGRPVVVPYDFDWSGMVDAPYTKLSFEVGESSYDKRQRYRVLCQQEEIVQAKLDHFLAQQKAIEALYRNSPYLSQATIDESVKNLRKGFKQMERAKNVAEMFLKNCPAGQ